jgi:hypothetical protein
MAGRGLRIAPIVTLALSFAVVFGLGRLVGPAPPDEPPTLPPVASAVPLSTAPASPSPESTATAGTAPPLSTPFPPPFSTPLITSTPEVQATTPVALEPDANGDVFMGAVLEGSTYPGSSLNPTVTPTDDGRLRVCVQTNDKIVSLRQQDWVQVDPPDGDQRCAYVRPGTDVAFHLESR